MFAIESANIVGYCNDSLTQAKFKMVCSQFQTIGKTADQMTIGDLVPGGTWAEGTDSIKVFADNSAVKCQLIYVGDTALPKVQKVNPAAVKGWYLKGTKTYDKCYNDDPLPLGGTVMAVSSKVGAYLTTAGEVVESEDGKITFNLIQAKFTMIGNCTPVALTLGDLVPGGTWAEGTDSIKVFADNSAVKCQLIYVGDTALPKVQKVNPAAVKGWYLKGTKTYDKCYNDEPMPAGMGVMAVSSKAASTLSIPSAL